MAANISNASSKVIFSGVRDDSIRTVPPEAEARAQHTALFYGFTERGKLIPELVNGGEAISLFGDETFNNRGPFYTHQMHTAEKVMGEGNKVFLKRVVPADATRAAVALGIETINTYVTAYQRDTATGKILTVRGVKQPVLKPGVVPTFDENGSINNPESDHKKVVGTKCRWLKIENNSDGNAYAGTLSGSSVLSAELEAKELLAIDEVSAKEADVTAAVTAAQTPETEYQAALNEVALAQAALDADPGNAGLQAALVSAQNSVTPKKEAKDIADLAVANAEAALVVAKEAKAKATTAKMKATESKVYPILKATCDYGSFGNNVGLRIGTNRDKVSLSTSQGGLLFDYQPVERSKAGTVDVIRNKYNERTTLFALKNGFYDPATDVDYGIGDIIAMHETVIPGTTPSYGPFDSVEIFEGNVETVLKDMLEKENAAIAELTPNLNIPALTDHNLVGFLDGKSASGVAHHSVMISTAPGSKAMTLGTTFFAEGGSDGDTSMASLEARIQWEMENNWKNPEYPLVNRRRFPITRVYDTGFSLPTKKALMKAMGYSPAIAFIGMVQDLSQPRMSAVEERAGGILLNAAAVAYPESEEFGTPTMRAVLYRQSYYPANSKYKGLLGGPTNHAVKEARFGGSGDGRLRKEQNYTLPGNNVLEGVLELNDSWLDQGLSDANWENSINGAVDRNRSTYYYPTLQTVYNNDTSTLNSPIVMGIFCDLVHVCDQIHTVVTGRNDLTNSQVLALYKSEFEALTDGAYAGLVTLECSPFFTRADEARNYSTSINITLFANGTKSVSTFNFINKRAE